MKILYSRDRAGGPSALLIILLVAAASMSAQQRSFQVISDQSSARVFLGTAEYPTSFDLGLAKVAGEIQLSFDDASASRVNLTIYSAVGEDQKIYGEPSVITFQSEKTEQRKDGKLEVTGKLTVSRVVADGVAMSLPANSKPVRTTHKVTFVFSWLELSASTSGSSASHVVPAQVDKLESGIQVSGSTSVNGENFPELLFAVQDVAWPPVADDDKCGTPSAPDESNREATCPASTSALSGKDDVSTQEAPPAGNLVTIRLKLTLAKGVKNASCLGNPSDNR